MYLQRLRPYNFRNLGNSVLEFSAGLNLIRGKNGQGKTNLVEAIYVLAFGKGFRTSESEELTAWNTNEASVFGDFVELPSDAALELGVSFGKRGKELYKQGERVKRASDFLGRFCCVCFTPDDLQTLKGAPSLRRKFLDRHTMFVAPGYIDRLLQVQRALAHKGALLKSGNADPALYEPWNEIILGEGVRVVEERERFVKALESYARRYLQRLAPHEKELSLSLRSNLLGLGLDELRAQAREHIGRELRARSPVLGPQRDELEVALGDISVREYASQGQTRSVMIALKLALIDLLHEVREAAPVVVLDDVESELDRSRVDALFDLIASSPRQVFVTGTDCAWISKQLLERQNVAAAQEIASFEVDNGVISRR